MSQCPGCLPSKQEKDSSFPAVREAAKKEAAEKGYPVAIVWEDDQWKFYNAFEVYQSGKSSLVKEVVSNG
jgi:hypothetical protein